MLFRSASAGSEKFGLGKSISADKQGEEDLGTAGHKSTDPNYDPTKDIKQAVLPTGKGVAAEPMHKLDPQPQETEGRKDLAVSPEGSETPEDAIVNRKKGPTAKKTAPTNPGAPDPYVPESEDEEDFEQEEASEEEVLEDLESMEESVFVEKYGMSKKDAVEYMYEAKSCDASEEPSEEEAEEEKKEKKASKMKEDIDAMLSGEELSEEFKVKEIGRAHV